MKGKPSSRWLIAGIAAVALLQTGGLGKMVTDRAALLRDGREVVLETGAIDPRDLFRGHYISLNLDITRIAPDTVTLDPALEPGMPVYVTLSERDDGYWRAAALSAEPPRSQEPVIRGMLNTVLPDQIAIGFPFDRYFAPEARALELEALDRANRLGVILALDAAGHGAIKGLMLDGARLYEEPLY
ncbi:MAG: GDYXXLXY domain-containing protein [Rhodobacterales bacterium]